MTAIPGALAGEVVLVTGGGSGIGRAVVRRFSDEGAHVVVLERDSDSASELTAATGLAVVVGDVSNRDDMSTAVETAVSRFGKLDALISNAGIHDYHRSLRSLSPAELDRAFDVLFAVNVKGLLIGAQCAVPHLRESGGSITVTVSPAGFQAGGGGPIYTATKHAVVGIIKQLAYELAPTVRVNGVAPGATRTNLGGPEVLGAVDDSWDSAATVAAVHAITPLQFIADPADHAGAYVLLTSRRDGRAITAEIIRSDGGMDVRVRPSRRLLTSSTRDPEAVDAR